MISPQDYSSLLSLLNSVYPIKFDKIELYRDWIGYVYFVSSKNNRYVFKIYRSFNTKQAIQTVGILNYLQQNDFPVAKIVPSITGDIISVDMANGNCAGLLFSYIQGHDVDKNENIVILGKQAAQLHNLMASYDGELARHNKSFYIDSYLNILHKKNYSISHIEELGVYGCELWNRMERISEGFCHNDMHTGNMIKKQDGQIVLIDFDTSGLAYSFIDVAVMSDGTHFNRFSEDGYELTLKHFDKFYSGYSEHKILSDEEIDAIFDFVAVRHYEIVANIVECQGLEEINYAFCDEQHDWLMRWRELCAKKRSCVRS